LVRDRLRNLRNEKDLTQQDLADFLGITRPAYTAYESGRRQPDNETLSKLADFFGVSVDYLLGRTNIRTPIETIAAHHDGEEWTEEELEDIEKFKEFIRMRREQEQNKK
jgi:transcriptional regulator with XRE-family HTH domain